MWIKHLLHIALFLFGDSPAPAFYVPTLRNTLSHLHRWCKQLHAFTTYEDGTECPETSARKIQDAGESRKRTNATFSLRWKFEIKDFLHSLTCYTKNKIIVIDFGGGNVCSCGTICAGIWCVSQAKVDRVPVFGMCQVSLKTAVKTLQTEEPCKWRLIIGD